MPNAAVATPSAGVVPPSAGVVPPSAGAVLELLMVKLLAGLPAVSWLPNDNPAAVVVVVPNPLAAAVPVTAEPITELT